MSEPKSIKGGKTLEQLSAQQQRLMDSISQEMYAIANKSRGTKLTDEEFQRFLTLDKRGSRVISAYMRLANPNWRRNNR